MIGISSIHRIYQHVSWLKSQVKLLHCIPTIPMYILHTVLQSWNISCDIKYHLLWSLIDVRRQRPTDVPWMVVRLHTTIINWAKVTLFTIFSPLVLPVHEHLEVETNQLISMENLVLFTGFGSFKPQFYGFNYYFLHFCLPKEINWSVRLCRRLFFDYLWIDICLFRNCQFFGILNIVHAYKGPTCLNTLWGVGRGI